ncbi:hypothetical protein [Lagierella sp.]|uniref:hypothetical protein n=1 Tax=Lagierella sp. TaxID=2849657 RepID=UPI002627DF41|nr:hypothetical protein [Lagierella sp.]
MGILIVIGILFSVLCLGLSAKNLFQNKAAETFEQKVLFLLNFILMGVGLLGLTYYIGFFIG